MPILARWYRRSTGRIQYHTFSCVGTTSCWKAEHLLWRPLYIWIYMYTCMVIAAYTIGDSITDETELLPAEALCSAKEIPLKYRLVSLYCYSTLCAVSTWFA